MTTERHPGLATAEIAGLTLPNRLAVAPMTRISATPDGRATARMAEYYAEFASGGFGLVITEGIYSDTGYAQGYLNQPGLATAEHAEAWRPVVDRVHAAGGRLVAQLMHAGALSQGNPYRAETAGPSAIRPRGRMMEDYGGQGEWPVPRAMSTADIDAAVRGFAEAAARARKVGFDGVEVHGANGYLIDQFLTDYTNRRTDRYGGPVANRARLAAEVVAAIRAEVGPRFPLGIRLSQTKVNDFSYRWAGGACDAETIFTAVAEAGAGYLHIASEGRDWWQTALLDGGVTVTGLARRVTGLPVIANGGMHELDTAARVLDDGHADLLSLGRGALANPDLPCRLARGLDLAPFDPAMLEPMATLANADGWRHKATC
ncbi:tRNA-dihydrouridine synthase [Pseudonocardia acaciae]|uniref:oxidoreductase n=1 Tax=Pseudonocardia acaciae TaxID=551276 RepID=UPI00056AA6F2|nr:NADH:flavin oxidoreductase [Pseudonocardia acaciae]